MLIEFYLSINVGKILQLHLLIDKLLFFIQLLFKTHEKNHSTVSPKWL